MQRKIHFYTKLLTHPEKVRVTMDDGKISVGFWYTFLGQGKVSMAVLKCMLYIFVHFFVYSLKKLEVMYT